MLKKRSRSSDNSDPIRAGRIFAGGILGFLVTVMLTFFAAFAVSREVLPVSITKWLGPVIILFSSFIASLLASRANRKKLICGLLAASLYGSVMIICGLMVFSAPMQPGRMLLSLAVLLGGMMLGVFTSGMRG